MSDLEPTGTVITGLIRLDRVEWLSPETMRGFSNDFPDRQFLIIAEP